MIMPLFDQVIDVSDAQGRIDWQAVASSGIAVAMVKATEGETFAANTWHANQRGATQAGIKVVPYHFVRPGDMAAQAAHFQEVSGLTAGQAFALDWEGNRTANAADMEALGTALAAIAGRKPLGYWGIPGSTPETPTDVMQTWDRWVPRYRAGNITDFTGMPATHQNPGTPFLFWQYTSAGTVPGITGPVDRSVGTFDSVAAMIAWCG
jgi:lysozyme